MNIDTERVQEISESMVTEARTALEFSLENFRDSREAYKSAKMFVKNFEENEKITKALITLIQFKDENCLS